MKYLFQQKIAYQ